MIGWPGNSDDVGGGGGGGGPTDGIGAVGPNCSPGANAFIKLAFKKSSIIMEITYIFVTKKQRNTMSLCLNKEKILCLRKQLD